MAVAEDGNNQTVSNQDLLKKLDYSRNPIQGVGPWNFERVTSSSLWSANDKTGGIGFELQLREDTGMVNSTGKQYKEENHRGSVLYRAIRNNSTFTYGDLSGHYIHTETKYSGSLGVDAKGTGSFSITANVKQDPAIQTGISWQY